MLLSPAWLLQWLSWVISSAARTRVLGAIVTSIAGLMIWAGLSHRTGLESALFIFGIFFLMIAVPMLLLFPKRSMNLASAFIPDDLSGDLPGWRMLGLLGIIVGITILMIGVDAL